MTPGTEKPIRPAEPVRKDHRPYVIKKAGRQLARIYVRRFIAPQLDRLGKGPVFMKPWHVEIFGAPIELGDYVTVIAAPDRKVRLAVWSKTAGNGRITIGDCGLICPGVRIGSAVGVTIGHSCMIASGAYITDADWHGIYDRMDIGACQPVAIGDNVWIGDSAIVCKGVTIGDNSIIGAGAVVVTDVPAHSVAAGNPARVVKTLDDGRDFVTRRTWYSDPAALASGFDALDRAQLRGNTIAGWLRHLLFPARGD